VEHVGDMRFFLDADHWSPFNRVQAGELSQVEQSRQETYHSLPESGGWSIRHLAAQLHSLQLNKGVVVASTGLPTVHH